MSTDRVSPKRETDGDVNFISCSKRETDWPLARASTLGQSSIFKKRYHSMFWGKGDLKDDDFPESTIEAEL